MWRADPRLVKKPSVLFPVTPLRPDPKALLEFLIALIRVSSVLES
jgi:hypothetical protein